MKMTGKQIKRFFRSKSGVLVFEGYQMKFVSYPNLKIYIYSNIKETPTPKTILISNSFNLVKRLEDNKTYDVNMDLVFLTFKDCETGKIVLKIDGIIL